MQEKRRGAISIYLCMFAKIEGTKENREKK